ncbi:Gfo/Idh/MocA family protein [Sporolactobacillus vineae]|uniref:Gfo/Idh/MocA family protein n=1 Tax=Sporolactobacillus vineae TaxID=444463 RepID=UPI00028829C3|nr:Gfo/Idh/MocA family oxidoreductase [Sporolactobacillus vineae]
MTGMRLATIGTSKITGSFLEAVQETGRMTYTAAYSRSADKARAFSEQHGGIQWFTSVEALAQSDAVDVVYVASPNGLHFQQVMTLLNGGKHVICEKPIFITLNELEQAFSLAEEKHVFLFQAIRNIQTPVFKELKAALHRAGRLRSSVLQLIQYSSRYDLFLDGKITNIFSPQFAGGALEDLGVYPLSAAISLFGPPADSAYFPVMLSSGVDGSGTLVLNYEDFVCTILCSKIAHSDAPSEIHGEQGTLRINNASNIHRLEWIDAHTKQDELIAEDKTDNDMIYEITCFADTIEQNDLETYRTLKEHSREVVRVMEKSRRDNGILFPNDQV